MDPFLEQALAELEQKIAGIRTHYTTPDPDPDPDPQVIKVTAGMDLQKAITAAPEGAILDLDDDGFITAIVINKPLTLRNGTIEAPPNTNDVVRLEGDKATLQHIRIVGDGTTKRGIAANGTNTTLLNVRVENIRRVGQETQAMAMWNTTGGLLAQDCYFEGGSQGFLSGGAGTTVPNTVPTNLVFERCTFTRKLEWRGQGYACKTAFELKNARNVRLTECVLENVWQEGQTGFAITLTPSDPAGNSPETTVQDVLVERCQIRNCGSGVSMLGFSQHQDVRPTTRGGNYRFINNDWTLSRAQFGGQGTLMQIGWEPDFVVWDENRVTVDGDAFIRVTDKKPITQFSMTRGYVRYAGTYGVFTPLGSRGTNWGAMFPNGLISSVEIVNAHAIFKANFPGNTYVTESL